MVTELLIWGLGAHGATEAGHRDLQHGGLLSARSGLIHIHRLYFPKADIRVDSQRKLQLPLDRLEAWLLTQRIHERIGLQVRQSRATQVYGAVEPFERFRHVPSGTPNRLERELLATHRGLDHRPAFHDREYRHALVILGTRGGILRAAGGPRCTGRAD